MRAVVLTLFLAFVAGERLVPHFNDHSTYVYKYEARLMGGLPEEGLARAGLKLSSKVLISAAGQNLYMLKLAEVELFQYSGIWPKGSFIKAEQLTSVMEPALTTPIMFHYTEGIVGEMQAPQGISKLTINIFKGILNILQLNIKKTLNVYELQEAGSQGVCKTLYTVIEQEENSKILHLTKTRDMNQCQERIVKDMGSSYAERYNRNQENPKQNLKGATVYRYNLTREGDSVLIREASVNELIQFSLFTEPKGAAQMETKQSLVFHEIKSNRIPLSQGQHQSIEPLKYEFSNEHLQTPIQLFKISNLKEEVKTVLEHLVSHNMERVHEDAPLKFLELVQLLRAACYEDLEMIWQQHKDTEKRNWIMDAVPMIGNLNTLKFIKEKFQADEITVTETIQALMTSVHMVTASREVIQQMEELVQHEKIQRKPFLPDITLLSYGTMVYKYCAQKEDCSKDLIEPIKERLKNAAQQEKIVLLLKALGNAGHPASLKTITSFFPIHGMKGASQPFQVHAEAIMALRNLAKKEPKMVQPLALQLYLDKSLHPELRMLACIVLFETRPQMALVLTVAASVKTEKNLQVASFTYSHMKSLTRCTAPVHAFVAAACNVAVKILSPKLERLSLRFSRAMHVDTYNYPLMLGAAASAFYINDAATILPRSVVAKTSAFFAGVAADIFEVGVRTEGLQEVLMRNPELLENADRITKMKRALRALSHLRTQPASKPLASIHLKLFGQEIAFAQLDKNCIEEAIGFPSGSTLQKLGRALLGSYHLSKSLLLSEVRHIMPTAAGLPLELSLYTSAVAAAKVEATTTPQLTDKCKLADLLQAGFNLDTRIKPSVAVNTIVTMGVNTDILQAALVLRAKFNAAVPSHLKVKVNFAEENFKIEALPVPVQEDIAVLQVETFAVARNVEDKDSEKITPMISSRHSRSSRRSTSSRAASNSKSSEVIPQDQEDTKTAIEFKVTQTSKKYCKAAVAGLRACIKMSTERTILSKYNILYALLGKHSAAVSVKQTKGEIQKIEVEAQFGSKAAEKLVKHINMDEEVLPQAQPALRKLKKILTPLNNTGSSSLSSSSSESSSSSSSSSSSQQQVSAKFIKKPTKSASRMRSLFRASSSSQASASLSRASSSSQASASLSRASSSSQASASLSRASSSSQASASLFRASSSSQASASLFRASSSSQASASLFRASSSSSQASASLFRASSSSSQASAQHKKKQKSPSRFQKNHQKQTRVQDDAGVLSRSSSSGASFEAIYRQNKFLGKDRAPYAAIIFRVVKANNELEGYQIAVYNDTARQQIIVAALEADNNWRLYADGVLLSKNKTTARFTWGANGRQYDAMITAETGSVDSHPAARLRLSWKNLPSTIRHYVKKMRKSSTPLKMMADLMRKTKKSTVKKLSATVVVTSERTLDILWKTTSTSQMAVYLPVTLPISEIRDAQSISNITNNIHQLLAQSVSQQCLLEHNKLKTFNSIVRNTEGWPWKCPLVLAQDCSDKIRFVVLKNRREDGVEHVTVKVADRDIDIILRGQEVLLRINGEDQAPSEVEHRFEGVLVKRRAQGIIVQAPGYGLPEVYYGLDRLQIKISEDMKGKTCGLCGRADGEVRQENRSPNGRLSSNSVSHAHSWTLAAESCQERNECRLTHESVQMRKQVHLDGRESQCYSTEPVLRCLPGCFSVKTTNVTVGYHCRSDGTVPNMSSIYDHEEHLKDQAEAHLACHCSPQCA